MTIRPWEAVYESVAVCQLFEVNAVYPVSATRRPIPSGTAGCSATTLRDRLDEQTRLGIFSRLEQIVLETCDRIS
jgi:hypothetical protein